MGGGLSRVCRPFFAIFGWKRPGKRSKTAAEKAEKPRYINGSQALPRPAWICPGILTGSAREWGVTP